MPPMPQRAVRDDVTRARREQLHHWFDQHRHMLDGTWVHNRMIADPFGMDVKIRGALPA